MRGQTKSQRSHTRKDIMEVIFIWSLVAWKSLSGYSILKPNVQKKDLLPKQKCRDLSHLLVSGLEKHSIFFLRTTIRIKKIYLWDSCYTNIWKLVFFPPSNCLILLCKLSAFHLSMYFKIKNNLSMYNTIFGISWLTGRFSGMLLNVKAVSSLQVSSLE